MSDRNKSSGLVQQQQQQQQNVRETRWTFIDHSERELELELDQLTGNEHNNDEQSECTELVSCIDQAYLFNAQPLLNSVKDQDERDYKFSGDNNTDAIIGANQIEQSEIEVCEEEEEDEDEDEERDSNDQQRYDRGREDTLFQFPNPISMSKSAQVDYNNWPTTSVAQATAQAPIEQQQSKQENSSGDQNNDKEEDRAQSQQVKLVQPQQQLQLKSSNNNQLLNNSSLAGSALSLCSLSRSSSSSLSSTSSSSSYSSSLLSSSTSPSFSFSTSNFDQKLFVPFATFRSTDLMTDKEAPTSSTNIYDTCELMFATKLPREHNCLAVAAGLKENQSTQVTTIPATTTISTTTTRHNHHHRHHHHEGKY